MAKERIKRCTPVALIALHPTTPEENMSKVTKAVILVCPEHAACLCLESREYLHAVGREAGELKMGLWTPRLLLAPAGEMSGHSFFSPPAAADDTPSTSSSTLHGCSPRRRLISEKAQNAPRRSLGAISNGVEIVESYLARGVACDFSCPLAADLPGPVSEAKPRTTTVSGPHDARIEGAWRNWLR